MAAASTIKSTVNSRLFAKHAEKTQRGKNATPNRPIGWGYFDTGNVSVATTNADDVGDEVFVLYFPANTVLLNLFYTTTDRDSATALVEDVIVETGLTAGGTETVLINDTTIGQTGSSVGLDALLKYTDVSNKKLGIRVVTAAGTPVAGTIRFRGEILQGAIDDYGIIKIA